MLLNDLKLKETLLEVGFYFFFFAVFIASIFVAPSYCFLTLSLVLMCCLICKLIKQENKATRGKIQDEAVKTRKLFIDNFKKKNGIENHFSHMSHFKKSENLNRKKVHTLSDLNINQDSNDNENFIKTCRKTTLLR